VPELVHADAEELTPAGEFAFHRVIATCQVAQIPAAWLGLLRPRGLLVTPWAPTPGAPGGALAVLEARAGAARGRFEGSLGFMWARGQRRSGHPAPPVGAAPDHTTRVGGDPRDLLDGEQGVLLSLLVPAWAHGMRMEPGADEPHVWVTSTRGPGWARLHPDGRVEQGGRRRLVDEFEGALALWRGQGAPPVSEYGLTVTGGGCRSVWLREPGSELWTAHADDNADDHVEGHR